MKVALLAGVATGRTAEAFVDCEDELVRIILPIPVDHAAEVLQRWQKWSIKTVPNRARCGGSGWPIRSVGRWVVDGLLDDEGGAAVAVVIDGSPTSSPQRASLDLAERRTLTQRRADAFVELVRRGAALPDTDRAAT